jgi:calcium-dependent protein kinase
MATSIVHFISNHYILCIYRPSAAKALQHKWLKEQLGGGDDDHTHLRRSSISHRSVRTGVFTNYLAVKKLKKAALGCIASNLTQEEVGTLANIFNSMDKNPDGTISLEQLDEAIARGNFSENLLHDLRRLRTDLAITGDHHLDWRDFVASTMDRSLALREDNIRYAFEHLRHSEAEYLTIDDLAEIFGGKAQAREVMSAVLDADKDGKVSFEDFSNALSEIMHTAEETDADDSSNPDVIA